MTASNMARQSGRRRNPRSSHKKNEGDLRPVAVAAALPAQSATTTVPGNSVSGSGAAACCPVSATPARSDAPAAPVRIDASTAPAIGEASASPGAGKSVPSSPTRPVAVTRPQLQSQPAANSPEPPMPTAPPTHDGAYSGIGGAAAQILALRDLVESPLRHPQAFEALGVRTSRGMPTPSDAVALLDGVRALPV